MKEAYVKFETSQLLKVKGFDWKVFTFYDGDGHLKHREGDCYFLYNWNYPTKDEYGSQYCSAPTHQMACDWVEKTYDYFIEISRHIDINGNYHYFYMILDKECKYASSGTHDNNYPSKYEAIEAALEYVLTKLI